ncbi:MAG: 4-hydroxythreonine-4-phosphate dehydrogenase PdxA [Planctomycetota bacterium]|nr:4-hydroxythreonine-4-phosphate dehydrogenase PdxA [Planctomycetaceae bacterium]MDQ3331425.1 4-hydroxythreonine-4-phosphate dehydrogenase PdxA [Planctomycetota bacterium]
MDKPRIAITLGDVAGIGPEVAVRAVVTPVVREICRPCIVGDPVIVSRAVEVTGAALNVITCSSLVEAVAVSSKADIGVWNPLGVSLSGVPPGRINGNAGRAAYEWLIAAVDGALTSEIDAIATAPLSKAALHAGGFRYPGHTEILAERCGVKDFAMMLYLPPGGPVHGPYGLGIAHTTLHTSIASVPGLLSQKSIEATIGLVDRFLKRLGSERPRVGVCALNPHAGEDGLFGDEEERLIEPAVRAARSDGIDAQGPFPADTLIRRATLGEFDGLTAMYHDQGHIALKLIAFGTAVNVTLGLPIVRTSPSHGTAFDIAWQGKADATGMIEAIRTAAKLAGSKAG